MLGIVELAGQLPDALIGGGGCGPGGLELRPCLFEFGCLVFQAGFRRRQCVPGVRQLAPGDLVIGGGLLEGLLGIVELAGQLPDALVGGGGCVRGGLELRPCLFEFSCLVFQAGCQIGDGCPGLDQGLFQRLACGLRFTGTGLEGCLQLMEGFAGCPGFIV